MSTYTLLIMINTVGIKLFGVMGQEYNYFETMTSDISDKSRDNH